MPSPPSTYHRYGAGPRVYTRDDCRDRKIWKERMLESARFREDLIGSPEKEGRKFTDGRERTAAIVSETGQNIEIDLVNTTVIVDPVTKENLYRDDTTRKVSPEAQRVELDLDNKPKTTKIRGSIRHLHERSKETPPSTKPQPHLLKRGKYNSTYRTSEGNGACHRDDHVVRASTKAKRNHHQVGSNVFTRLMDSATEQNNNEQTQSKVESVIERSIESNIHKGGSAAKSSTEAEDSATNHGQSLNTNEGSVDHLAHSSNVKFEDPRKEASPNFNRPYNFLTDAQHKRRVPHVETHYNIFHEEKDFEVRSMDTKDASIGARKKKSTFHTNQKHHFLHHSNEDHLTSGAKERESARPKRRLGKHHHFEKSSVLDCHSSWQGASDQSAFDESHESVKVHDYDHGHDTSKKFLQPPGGNSALQQDLSPIKEGKVKHKRINEAPGGIDQVRLENLTIESVKAQPVKPRNRYESRVDHIEGDMSTKEGSEKIRRGRATHLQPKEHLSSNLTSSLTETESSMQRSSKILPHGSQRHFGVTEVNVDHIKSGGGEAAQTQRRHMYHGDHVSIK